MNDAIGPKSCSNTQIISVLDIFGFENFDTNSFEQLNINYANERLHSIFTNAIFETQKEYLAEEIPWTMIQYPDNSDRINLFEGKTGILSMSSSRHPISPPPPPLLVSWTITLSCIFIHTTPPCP